MCTHFCKDLVTGYCLYLVEDLIPDRHPFSNGFYDPCLIVLGLMSHEIRVQVISCETEHDNCIIIFCHEYSKIFPLFLLFFVAIFANLFSTIGYHLISYPRILLICQSILSNHLIIQGIMNCDRASAKKKGVSC